MGAFIDGLLIALFGEGGEVAAAMGASLAREETFGATSGASSSTRGASSLAASGGRRWLAGHLSRGGDDAGAEHHQAERPATSNGRTDARSEPKQSARDDYYEGKLLIGSSGSDNGGPLGIADSQCKARTGTTR